MEDGRVWVLNSLEPYFLVLGPDGTVERTFGRRGGGPEDFSAPWALVRGPEPADLWAYDAGRHALIRISGEVRRDLALPPDSVPRSSMISFKGAGIDQAPPWLESTRDGFLMARSRGELRETALQTWSADIVLLREEGAAMESAVHAPIADLVGDPSTRYGAATTLLPYPVWTVCANGSVGLYDPLANEVRRIPGGGGEPVVFPLPDERQVEITVDRWFDMVYRQLQENIPAGQLPSREVARSATREQNEELVNTSAGVFPEYADMQCSPDGTVWIRLFDIDADRLGQGSDWIRVPADGPLTLVHLPSGFRTFRIEDDRIWGTLPDAFGVESIVMVDAASIG